MKITIDDVEYDIEDMELIIRHGRYNIELNSVSVISAYKIPNSTKGVFIFNGFRHNPIKKTIETHRFFIIDPSFAELKKYARKIIKKLDMLFKKRDLLNTYKKSMDDIDFNNIETVFKYFNIPENSIIINKNIHQEQKMNLYEEHSEAYYQSSLSAEQ